MKKYLVLSSFLVCASSSFAGPLTFGFTNPSFGGNPFYSSHFLGMAETQKIPKEQQVVQTEVERFQAQLQSRILSALSSQITQQIFQGEFKSGEAVKIGDITVTPTLVGEKLTLDIVQGNTVTQFSIDAPTNGTLFE